MNEPTLNTGVGETRDNGLNTHDILSKYGGTLTNNLQNIIISNEDSHKDVFNSKSSLYYDIGTVEHFLVNHKDKFCLLSMNVQSLRAKFDQLQSILQNLKHKSLFFDCVCLQETWLSENDNYSLFNIDGYTLIKKDLEDSCSKHGGLLIYIKNDYPINNIEIISNKITFEGLVLKTKLNDKIITIVNIYRPPSNVNRLYNKFIQDYIPIVSDMSKKNGELIIAGDFNIDLLKLSNNDSASLFFDHMVDFHLLPKINFPTRFNNNSCTLIDQIYIKYSNAFNQSNSGILFSNLSDHCPVFIGIDFKKVIKPKRPKQITIKCRQNNFNNLIKTDLETINFDSLFDINNDPNVNYTILNETLINLISKYSISKTVRFNKQKHKLNDWITYGILKSIKNRDKIYKDLRSASVNTPIHETLSAKLKKYNAMLKSVIKTAKTLYFEKEFNKNSNDIRKTWDTIKTVLNNRPTTNVFPQYIIDGDKSVTDKKEIANHFNDFFINIGKRLAETLHSDGNISFENYLIKNNQLRFKFQEVTENMILKIINSLKSNISCGVDNISSAFIKTHSYLLCKPLTKLINQSLNLGIFPDKLKVAKVFPIFKGNNLNINQMNNYRPISVLPIISKIFEKIVYNQIYNYLTENELLFISQYGFRENHSTELAVTEFVDTVYKHLDNSNNPLAVFMDLSKAFDTIDHDILTTKLRHYGILGNELNWFISYLDNRKQFVSIENSSSSLGTITTGVPQGSILGPLLFLIYVNDLASSTSDMKCLMYADDTSLIIPFDLNKKTIDQNSSCLDQQTSTINNKLNSVFEWLTVNKLSLNTNKTKFMIFHFPQRIIPNYAIPLIKINNKFIEKVNTFKFLGIYLDCNLSWENHVNEITKKISKTVGVLSILKHYFPQKILLTIYNSLILSHFNYGITLWGFHNCTRLKSLQKKALRHVSKLPFRVHTQPICKLLKTMLIDDIFNQACLKFYYKFKKGFLPSYFYVHNFIETYAPNRNLIRISRHPPEHLEYVTDSSYFRPIIKTPFYKKKSCHKCLRYHIPHLINNHLFPSCVTDKIDTHSLKGFSNYYRNYILDNYKNQCTNIDCFVCSRYQIL